MPDTPSDGAEPQVPEQFRDAYRRAYEEALGAGTHVPSQPMAQPTAHVSETEYRTRGRWVVPVGVAAGAVVLILCAYVLGRMVSGGDEATADGPPRDVAASPTAPTAPAHSGPVTPVRATSATAACTSKPGVDAAGRPVHYGADNTVDGKPSTAWRCDGLALGQQLVFSLPAGTEIAEVGLVPGYAKTDRKSHVDRYAENNRITKVTWILPDGTEVTQDLSPDPMDRSLRSIRVPQSSGDRVTLRIDAVKKGKRNTTMISEVRFAAQAR